MVARRCERTSSSTRGRAPDYTPIATQTDGGATPPSEDPDEWVQREANGLRQIENWLHTLHVKAGGWNGYAAGEWVQR